MIAAMPVVEPSAANVEGRVRMLRFEGLRELRDQLGAKAVGAFNDKPVSLCS
jgi:hypothetical protein